MLIAMWPLTNAIGSLYWEEMIIKRNIPLRQVALEI